MTRVTNSGSNPVEAAGRIFPPRRTIDVDLTDAQTEVVRRRRRLHLADDGEADGRDGLDDLTVDELRDRVDEAGLEVPASARKADLIAALREGG